MTRRKGGFHCNGVLNIFVFRKKRNEERRKDESCDDWTNSDQYLQPLSGLLLLFPSMREADSTPHKHCLGEIPRLYLLSLTQSDEDVTKAGKKRTRGEDKRQRRGF